LKSYDAGILIKNISKKWYVLSGAILVGGFIALAVSFVLIPVYESNAIFSVAINYAVTGALTDVEEDQTLRGVGNILLSDIVVENTIKGLQLANVEIDQSDFLDGAHMDREEFRWTIRFRNTDSMFSKKVTDVWSEQAIQIINESLFHARLGAIQQELLDNLGTCLQKTSYLFQVEKVCGFNDIPSILREMEKLSRMIESEESLSNGLQAYLDVELVQKPILQNRPVRHNRNILIISGSFVGFLLGLLITAIWQFPKEQ